MKAIIGSKELMEDLDALGESAVASLSEQEKSRGKAEETNLRQIARSFLEYYIYRLSGHNRSERQQLQLRGLLADLPQLKFPLDLTLKIAGNCACLCMERLLQSSTGGLPLGDSIIDLNQVSLEINLMIAQVYMEQNAKEYDWFLKALEDIEGFPPTLASLTDADTLLKSALHKLKGLVSAERGAIVLGKDANSLGWAMGDCGEGEFLGPQPLKLDQCATEKLFGFGSPVEIDDRAEAMPCLNELRKHLRCSSMILVPMRIRDKTIGLILLCRGEKSPAFGEKDVRLAALFARGLARSLENVKLHASEQQKIKNTVALLEITRVINSTLDLEAMITQLARMVVDIISADSCIIYLLDTKEKKFLPRAVFGSILEASGRGKGSEEFSFARLDPSHLRELNGGNTVLISKLEENPLFDTEILAEKGIQGIVIHPLLARENWLGILVILHGKRAEEISREERNVIAAIGSQAAIAIENALLYEDIERSYFSTVKALAKAIEVKDPYTHGHSERVTEYALMIAEAMDLDDREKQNIKYAATLHDIGKIGIAGKVLNKPGALTDEEYLHVKTHPLLGDTIVEPVEFLQGPRPLILHHHERYDGRGYPDGLKGDEIPLGARIITVADSYEAMRSDRPYRKALSPEDARAELIRNSGTQFDPHVVEIFLEILDQIEGQVEGG